MPTVTITGTFKNASANNDVTVEVFRGIPSPLDNKWTFTDGFSQTLGNLVSGLLYFIDITGHTPGTFDFSVTGDVVSPVATSYTNDISDGIMFTVK